MTSREDHPILSPDLTTEDWLALHERSHQYFCGPRDTRIPSFLPCLSESLCTLRSSLSQLRLAFGQKIERFKAFRKAILEQQQGLHGHDPTGRLGQLLDSYFARIDWREIDIFEMILEFLEQTSQFHDPRLLEELRNFRTLRQTERHSYDQAVQGLISEARGNLMGVARAFWELKNLPDSFPELDGAAIGVFYEHLALAMGLDRGQRPLPQSIEEYPSLWWDSLFSDAYRLWQERGVNLPLKPFEKASLYLLEGLPVRKPGHRAFVRHLIEDESAYRRLLAACYAPVTKQLDVLSHEIERFRRLPEFTAHPVDYTERELRWFLFAFLLRPDPVGAIIERERDKDIYRALPGLPPKACLPRVLQEVQNIFDYVTPEAFQKIVEVLKVDAVDIVRLIASFKQYSADPGGNILVYICKGTACFLRGQPELSRRLSAIIEAKEGEVGVHGIQFIEMDCFGVCHLAPVVKARDHFLGNQTPADIPVMIEKLLKGPVYENRVSFIRRIQEILAPGRSSEPMPQLEISAVIEPSLDEECAKVDETYKGWQLKVDSKGQVFACSGIDAELLGNLLLHGLGFSYLTPDGYLKTGCLITDEGSHVHDVVNFPSGFLKAAVNGTLKPQAMIENGALWLESLDGRWRLGDYDANTLVVVKEGGSYRLVQLSGPVRRMPPEKEEGFKTAHRAGEDEAFLNRQDRYVLGFAAGSDSTDIDSYLAHGGYKAVYRVLGLKGEPPWEPRKIVAEISSARLRGRGGAGFPTGSKWEAVRLAKCLVQENDPNQDEVKLIVANGDEGDPGAFMDRTLIEEKPHQVIEGMILAALATGSRYGVIYVRKEYEDAVRRLEHALFQARRKNFLGQHIFGMTGLHFDIDIRLGAGAFVAGEKRAIMRAIEGEPAEPTLTAVSNTHRGLWGKPTLLNNVETFANVPLIINNGGSWYSRQGTERSGGTKIFSVAGIVKRTGLVEVRFGRTLHDIVQICGGIQEGKRLAGVQIGGPSGAILSLTGVREYLLYTPLDFDTFDQVGAMLGSGGLVFIGEDDDVVRLARHFTDWLAHESCGQCPPCFYGTASLGETLDAILQEEGYSDHVHVLWAKSDAIKAGSQCGLGSTASNPVTSALRFFPHVFLHHLLGNPRLNQLECFRILEALRFLTREHQEVVAGRRRQLVGYSFALKKHIFRHLVTELEKLDQYQPPFGKRTASFLELLQVPLHEAGQRDVVLEVSLTQYQNHLFLMQERGLLGASASPRHTETAS